MDESISLSVGALLTFFGFLTQAGITVGAIAFSHGALNQRVRGLEDKVKDHTNLATSVTRLETEMEGVSREIKGLREDLRRAHAEITAHAEFSFRRPRQEPSPYHHPGARRWVEDDWGPGQ